MYLSSITYQINNILNSIVYTTRSLTSSPSLTHFTKHIFILFWSLNEALKCNGKKLYNNVTDIFKLKVVKHNLTSSHTNTFSSLSTAMHCSLNKLRQS